MILMNGHYKKNVNPEVHQDDELRDFLGLELTGLTGLTELTELTAVFLY